MGAGSRQVPITFRSLKMVKSRTLDLNRIFVAFSAIVLGSMIAFIAVADADAQRRNQDSEQEEPPTNRTLSTNVGRVIQEAVELQDVEDFPGIIRVVTPLLSQELTEYERFIALQLRGTARFQTDDLDGTIADFRAMLNTGAATTDEANTLRVQLGQLYIATDNLTEGIRMLEMAVNGGVELNESLLRLLTQAYYQAERYTDGLRFAEQYYRTKARKVQGDFTLMQAYYQQLNRPQDELRVVREALDAFPGERRSWQNLVSLFARLERESDAFEANKLMYLNGLFQECTELYRLSQYYSYYENPYRGATILERSINSGICEGDVRQLETLANMWRQAREFDRATPVLQRLANQTGEGEWALKLAEAQFELNNLSEAATAFEQALEFGGLENEGTAWALLGTVRYQLGQRQSALTAYRQSARFSESRREANGWIEFINSQIAGEIRRERQLEQVRVDGCRLEVEREVEIGTIVGAVDDTGQVVVPVPEDCERYFNQYGDQIREAGMSDEEAAALQEEVAAEIERRIQEIAEDRA